jgi:hypothetical protein
VGSVVQAAAWVVLVFALVERLNLRELEKHRPRRGIRSSLPAAGNADRVSVVETIFTVIFNTIFLQHRPAQRHPGLAGPVRLPRAATGPRPRSSRLSSCATSHG